MMSCSAVKAEEEKDVETFMVKVFVFPRNHYMYRGPALQELAGCLPAEWQIVNKLIFLLCFHVQLLVFLLNCLCLKP